MLFIKTNYSFFSKNKLIFFTAEQRSVAGRYWVMCSSREKNATCQRNADVIARQGEGEGRFSS